tara:strand:- start:838 stop:1038 length:201 start_codon:yes stop_codon:yes gene_type:complete
MSLGSRSKFREKEISGGHFKKERNRRLVFKEIQTLKSSRTNSIDFCNLSPVSGIFSIPVNSWVLDI